MAGSEMAPTGSTRSSATAAQTSRTTTADVEGGLGARDSPAARTTTPTATARATAVQAPPTATRAMTKASSLGDQEKLCLRNSKLTLKRLGRQQAQEDRDQQGGRRRGSAPGTRTQSEIGTASGQRRPRPTVQGCGSSGRCGARSSCSATLTCISPGKTGAPRLTAERRPEQGLATLGRGASAPRRPWRRRQGSRSRPAALTASLMTRLDQRPAAAAAPAAPRLHRPHAGHREPMSDCMLLPMTPPQA